MSRYLRAGVVALAMTCAMLLLCRCSVTKCSDRGSASYTPHADPFIAWLESEGAEAECRGGSNLGYLLMPTYPLSQDSAANDRIEAAARRGDIVDVLRTRYLVNMPNRWPFQSNLDHILLVVIDVLYRHGRYSAGFEGKTADTCRRIYHKWLRRCFKTV